MSTDPGTGAGAEPAAGDLPPARIRRARTAVAVVFVLSGLGIATWLARIPQVRDQLGLTPGQLGRILLALALGSMFALPVAGLVVNRFGAGRTVAGGTVLAGAGMLVVGTGAEPVGSALLVAAGLLVAGFGVGIWDVAMNVEGAAVERRLGRSIMPRLHAGFSLGAALGAGSGAAAAALGWPVAVHLAVVGVLLPVAGGLATGWFLPAERPTAGAGREPGAAGPRRRAGLWAAWREPRTVLIGLLVLAFALTEGIAYDWLAVGLVDGFATSNSAGAAGLAVFVVAMTAARTAGTRVLDRFGRVPVIRVSAALAAAGVLLVVFGPALPVAIAGALVWGLGCALGFPVGMSAGADDPARAAIRVSVVASIAYSSFLAGPPLLGWLGDHLGVQRALLVAAAAMLLALLTAGATRPLRPAPAGRDGALLVGDPARPGGR